MANDEILTGPINWLSVQADVVRRYANENTIVSEKGLYEGVKQLLKISANQERKIEELEQTIRIMSGLELPILNNDDERIMKTNNLGKQIVDGLKQLADDIEDAPKLRLEVESLQGEVERLSAQLSEANQTILDWKGRARRLNGQLSEQSNTIESLIDKNTTLNEIANWAQAVLTALNVGDVKKDSLLHLKLREIMVEYRANET